MLGQLEIRIIRNLIFLLPKQNRLPAYLIPQVLQKGKRYTNAVLSLFVIVNATIPVFSSKKKRNIKLQEKAIPARFAIIVPTAIDKRAVLRNKIKRRLREIIRNNLPKIIPDISATILAKKGVILINYRSIKAETEELLKTAKLLTSEKNNS